MKLSAQWIREFVEATVDDRQLALFDEIAEATMHPDAHFAQLRRLYARPGLEVPSKIVNGLTQKREAA